MLGRPRIVLNRGGVGGAALPLHVRYGLAPLRACEPAPSPARKRSLALRPFASPGSLLGASWRYGCEKQMFGRQEQNLCGGQSD